MNVVPAQNSNSTFTFFFNVLLHVVPAQYCRSTFIVFKVLLHVVPAQHSSSTFSIFIVLLHIMYVSVFSCYVLYMFMVTLIH